MANFIEASVERHDDAETPLRRVSRLEGENRRLRAAARNAGEIEAALRERVKELNCFYGITQLVEQHGDSFGPLLQGIVDLLPASWQFQDVCCARLTLGPEVYVTADFRETVWRQSAEITVHGEAAGAIEVYYLRQKPDLDEGPFLKEERALIDAIGKRVGKIVTRVETARRLRDAMKQLRVERTSLQQANAALHGVMARIEDQKKDMQDSIMANVDKVLMPVLHALEAEVPTNQKRYVGVLREGLEEITSPFVDKLSKVFRKLTAVEIRICNMIRNGLSTKEIAQLRHVSPATVARQRERIRKKLEITGTDTNLATFLGTFLSGHAR